MSLATSYTDYLEYLKRVLDVDYQTETKSSSTSLKVHLKCYLNRNQTVTDQSLTVTDSGKL
jgi:hypothetical protein